MRLFLRIHYNLIWPAWKPIMYLNTNKKIKHFLRKKTWQGFWWTWPPPDIMYFGFLLHEVWLWWPLQWVCDATLLSKWRKGFCVCPTPSSFLSTVYILVKYIFLNYHSLMPAFSWGLYILFCTEQTFSHN